MKGKFPEQSDLFQRVFDSNPQPMWVYDLETLAFLAVNDAAVRHYGYSRDEFLSMLITEIRPPEEVTRLFEMVSRLGLGIQRSGSWKHRRKDGTIIDVEISSHGILFNDRPARFVMVQDVTEQKRAIEALRRSEEKYRDLFENANDAIFIVSQDLRYLDVNKKGVEVLGYSREELLSMRIIDVIPPEQVPRSESEFQKLRDRGSYEKFVGKVRTKDNRWLDVEVSSSAIIEDNRVVGSRDILRDITERKKMEDELLRAQKLESIGMLAGGLAHDFNNLLTAILGNISLAKLDARRGDGIYEQLEQAERASQRAQDLTQQLLTFSRGGAPIRKTLSLGDLAQESVTFSLRGTRTRCEFIIPGDLWPVDADAGQLSQVFNNLAFNADQAMPEGGRLWVRCSNVTVTKETALPLTPGAYVQVTFTDQGIGIPPEHFEKIFDPYFTTKQKGSGLGLATSYSILHRHGGHITVESALGRGTSFHLYLPASSQRVRQEPAEELPAERGIGSILVVDDEEMIRDVACKILIKQGYEVACARDGQTALVLYAKAQRSERPFDVVIMDLTIPGGLGGKEATQKLLEIDPQAQVIVSSGLSNDPIMAEYRDHGFIGVIAKPYTVKKLSAIVQAVFAQRRGAGRS